MDAFRQEHGKEARKRQFMANKNAYSGLTQKIDDPKPAAPRGHGAHGPSLIETKDPLWKAMLVFLIPFVIVN
jgi:hypothetical protein